MHHAKVRVCLLARPAFIFCSLGRRRFGHPRRSIFCLIVLKLDYKVTSCSKIRGCCGTISRACARDTAMHIHTRIRLNTTRIGVSSRPIPVRICKGTA